MERVELNVKKGFVSIDRYISIYVNIYTYLYIYSSIDNVYLFICKCIDR